MTDLNFGHRRPRFAYRGMRKRQPLTTPKRWLLGVVFVLVLSPLLGLVYTYTRAGESAHVQAATASTLNFQARLMNNTGSLVADGTYSVQFKLYTAVVSGTNEWTETQTVTVKNGYLSVYLGTVTPFSGSIDWSQEKWLTMNVNSDGEMTPRIKLTAVPYAFRAGQADSLTLGSGSVTAAGLAQLAAGSVQSVNSTVAGLRINQTGTGGLLQLQGNGADVFTVDKTGNGTLAGTLTVSGSTVSVGSATQTGLLLLNDGSGGNTSLQANAGGLSMLSSGNITIGTADTTGTLLVLDTKTDSIDPAGVDGAMYYNSGLKKFRCFEDGLWKDCVNGSNYNATASFVSGLANVAANTAGQVVETLIFTSATAVSNTAGATGFTAPAAGSFRTCLVKNNAAITNGTLNLRWRVNGVSVGAGACTMTNAAATNRQSATSLDPGVVNFSAGDTIGIAFDTGVGFTPATNDFTVYWTVEYKSSLGGGAGTPSLQSAYNNSIANEITLDSTNNGLTILDNATPISGNLLEVKNNSGSTTYFGVSATGVTSANTLTVSSGGLAVTGNSTIAGTLSGLTGLTVASGGASISGGLNNNSGGITNAGSIGGVAGLTLTSGNLALGGGNITGGGSIAGTSLSVSGTITANTTNTINGLSINSGSLSGITGFGQTSGTFSVTGTGAITLGGGSNTLTIDSSAFDVTSAGAVSGITTLSASGAITAATATNTINGLIINAGALSGITGLTQTSGAHSVTGTGAITLGGGSNALTIDSSAFDVTSAGAVSGITTLSLSGAISGATATNTINGLIINAGALSAITGFSQASGTHSITGTGAITLGGGSNALTIDSTAFDVTSAGAVSGITTLSLSGAITGATATNTINGLVVNSGSLSSITGFNQTSGNFAMSGTGTFGTGSGAVSLNGATTISTATNSATALTVNGTTGTAATALQIAQTGNAANLVITNTARTTGALVSLTHSTSAFSGTGLLLNFASGSGSFTGDFLDFQLNGTSRFKVDNTGGLTISATSSASLTTIGVSGGLTYFNINATNNRIQIGSSSSDATSILLILDSGTADPTAVNGGSYYNSTNNKSRCAENGVWTDCNTTPLLGETTLGAAGNTISVTLNRTVEYLHCRVDVKSRTASSIPWLRFNNNTTANAYNWTLYGITAAAVIDAQDNSDSEMELASAGSTVPFSADINITNFSDVRKAVDWTAVGAENVGTNMNRFSGGATWNVTGSQITSVQFVASTGNFAAGSHAWCEGRDIR